MRANLRTVTSGERPAHFFEVKNENNKSICERVEFIVSVYYSPEINSFLHFTNKAPLLPGVTVNNEIAVLLRDIYADTAKAGRGGSYGYEDIYCYSPLQGEAGAPIAPSYTLGFRLTLDSEGSVILDVSSCFDFANRFFVNWSV